MADNSHTLPSSKPFVTRGVPFCEYPGCTKDSTMTFGTDYTPVCDQHSGWHRRDELRAPVVEPEPRCVRGLPAGNCCERYDTCELVDAEACSPDDYETGPEDAEQMGAEAERARIKAALMALPIWHSSGGPKIDRAKAFAAIDGGPTDA